MSSNNNNRTCYDRDGNVASYMFACYPDRGQTNCCSSVDYCTDIGLCLDSAGNNNVGTQGCTVADFDPVACPKPCPEAATDLEYCGVTSLLQPANYCCDRGIAKCCATSEGQFTLPLFSTVFKAPGAASAAPTVTVTAGAVSSASGAAASDSDPGSGSASDNASRIKTMLALAIPLACMAVVLVAVLIWTWQRHKTIATASGSGSGSSNGAPSSAAATPKTARKPMPPPQEMPTPAGFDDDKSGGNGAFYHQLRSCPAAPHASPVSVEPLGGSRRELESVWADKGDDGRRNVNTDTNANMSNVMAGTPPSGSVGTGTAFTGTPQSREPLRWNVTAAEVESTWNVGELAAETPVVYKASGLRFGETEQRI